MIKTFEVYKPHVPMKEHYLKAPNFFWSVRMFALNPVTFKILQYFVRQTYGWQRDTYSVGIDQIATDCNINRKTASHHVGILLRDGWLEVVKEADPRSKKTREYKLIHGRIEIEA